MKLEELELFKLVTVNLKSGEVIKGAVSKNLPEHKVFVLRTFDVPQHYIDYDLVKSFKIRN